MTILMIYLIVGLVLNVISTVFIYVTDDETLDELRKIKEEYGLVKYIAIHMAYFVFVMVTWPIVLILTIIVAIIDIFKH